MLDELPEELIIKIIQILQLDLKQFDVRHHLYQPFLLLNKNWRRALLYEYHQYLDITNSKTPNTLKFFNLSRKTNSYKHLKLKTTNPRWNSQSSCLSILNACDKSKLLSLTLDSIDLEDPLKFENLNKLELINSYYHSFFTFKHLHLTELMFYDCNINDNDLCKILSIQDRVRVLSVEKCLITNQSIKSFYRTQITSLNISQTLITPTGLIILGTTLPNLTEISIKNMPFTLRQTDNLSLALSLFKDLQILDIRGTKAAFPSILSLPSFNLQSLSFGDDTFIKEQSIRTLLLKFPYLKTIRFSNNTKLTDLCLAHIIKSCRCLEELVLPKEDSGIQLQMVYSSTLMKIPTLVSLVRFEACGYQISEDVVLSFATHAKRLKVLILHHLLKSRPVVGVWCIDLLLSGLDLEVFGCKRIEVSDQMMQKLQQKYYKTLLIY